jgi:hypothetical protein
LSTTPVNVLKLQQVTLASQALLYCGGGGGPSHPKGHNQLLPDDWRSHIRCRRVHGWPNTCRALLPSVESGTVGHARSDHGSDGRPLCPAPFTLSAKSVCARGACLLQLSTRDDRCSACREVQGDGGRVGVSAAPLDPVPRGDRTGHRRHQSIKAPPLACTTSRSKSHRRVIPCQERPKALPINHVLNLEYLLWTVAKQLPQRP